VSRNRRRKTFTGRSALRAPKRLSSAQSPTPDRTAPLRAVLRRGNRRALGEAESVPVWPASAVRILFGVIFAVDASFKWRVGFRETFLDIIKQFGQGQPSALHWWFDFWTDAVTPHPQVWAYSIAVIETLLALALILGLARKITYILTAITTLGIWAVAEGFGGPYTATSTDIGTGIMYTVVAASLLVLSLQHGPSRYSVDYLLEKRISWWHWVAEFGAHNHPPRPDQPAVASGGVPVGDDLEARAPNVQQPREDAGHRSGPRWSTTRTARRGGASRPSRGRPSRGRAPVERVAGRRPFAPRTLQRR
jgi:thiosulfate dehydrogenase (quinone) large subunit